MREWLIPSLMIAFLLVVFALLFAVGWFSAALLTRIYTSYRSRFPKRVPKTLPPDFGRSSRRPFGQRLKHFVGGTTASHEIPPQREFQLFVPLESSAPHKPKSPTLIARLLHHIRALVRGIDNAHKNGNSSFTS